MSAELKSERLQTMHGFFMHMCKNVINLILNWFILHLRETGAFNLGFWQNGFCTGFYFLANKFFLTFNKTFRIQE